MTRISTNSDRLTATQIADAIACIEESEAIRERIAGLSERLKANGLYNGAFISPVITLILLEEGLGQAVDNSLAQEFPANF